MTRTRKRTTVIKGIDGQRGEQGVQGATGPQGLTGSQGATGPQGIQGVKGDTGSQGIQGVKGDIGDTGAQGVKGDTGAQGIQGVKGDVGNTGAQGIQGLKGDKGDIGAPGVTGSQGATGSQGMIGPQGIQGPQGLKGDTGDIGPQGADGAQGIQGIQGNTGATGPNQVIQGTPTNINGLLKGLGGIIRVAIAGSDYVVPSDTRLTNARPASDVSAWAKAGSKPTYTAAEVGAAASNDSRLSDARPASDVSAWAKAGTKPTYTAAEVGAAANNDSRLSDARPANGGNADTLDGVHVDQIVQKSELSLSKFNNLTGIAALPITFDLVINGDENTFYPVHIFGGNQDLIRTIKIWRSYSEQAPWDPIGTGAHHAGLMLTWQGNFGGWGGANYFDRLEDFSEQYTNVVGDMYQTTHCMGYTFFLRGGGATGALYHFASNFDLNGFNTVGPQIGYDTSVKFFDHTITDYIVYAPAAISLANRNATRIDGLLRKKQSELDSRYLGKSAKAADSGLLDGIASTRFIFGDGSIGKSTQVSDMNDLNLPSGFYFCSNAIGAPSTEWYNFIMSRGNSWGNPDGYGFQMAQCFWNDTVYFRRLSSGVWQPWRTLFDSHNFDPSVKADLASPMFSGTPTVPTPATNDNSTVIANTAFVKAVLAALVASSPAALDTLNELAAALGNDPNFATTITNALAGKLGNTGGQSISEGHAINADAKTLELYADYGTEVRELSIRFHQGSRWYQQIRNNGAGFRFTQGHNGDVVDIYAANIHSNNNVVWHAGNFDPSTKVGTGDSRLTDARPASDVSAWAKVGTKPTYNAAEVGAAANNDSRLSDARPANGGNADTLDGLHDTDFSRYASVSASDIDGIALKPGIYNVEGQGISGLPGIYNYIIQLGSYSGGGYRVQLAANYQNGINEGLWMRSCVASSWGTWYRMWDGNNFDPSTKVGTGDSRLSDARPASDVSAWAKAGTKPTYTYDEVGAAASNDSRLSDARTPIDISVTYGKVANALKTKATVTSTVDLSANGQGAITLSANTAFTFSGFELNKTYLLIVTANGFTPSWAAGAIHVPVEGNAAFGTAGVFYVSLTCIDATSGSEKLLTLIMKGA